MVITPAAIRSATRYRSALMTTQTCSPWIDSISPASTPAVSTMPGSWSRTICVIAGSRSSSLIAVQRTG